MESHEEKALHFHINSLPTGVVREEQKDKQATVAAVWKRKHRNDKDFWKGEMVIYQ